MSLEPIGWLVYASGQSGVPPRERAGSLGQHHQGEANTLKWWNARIPFFLSFLLLHRVLLYCVQIT